MTNKEKLLKNVKEEMKDFIMGKINDKEEIQKWKERLREYFRALETAADDKCLSSDALAAAEQEKQKTFLQRDVTRSVF